MDIHDPRTQKMLLVGVAVVGILYLYFFSTFLPFGHRAVAAQRHELEQQYRQLSSDLSKARQTLNNRAEIERQYEILNRRWDVAASLLPEQREVADLLRKVTLVGQQSGVEFELFQPMPQIPGDVYNENPVDVRVVGGYHQVGSFLAEVANLDRIVNVSHLVLTENDDRDSAPDQTVEAHFTATAYTLNTNPSPPASAEKSPGKKASRGSRGKKGGKNHEG